MKHWKGGKDPERRQLVEAGTYRGDPATPEPFRAYRKIALAYATRIPESFTVTTPEGIMGGKAGDYLAVGTSGEMYPIDAAVFTESYEEVVP